MHGSDLSTCSTVPYKIRCLMTPLSGVLVPLCTRGGYNSDDITKVGLGGGGGLLSQEAVMTE